MVKINQSSWHIKSRYILLIFVISLVISTIIWVYVSPEYLNDNPPPLSEAMFSYVFYFFLLVLIITISKKASLNWRSLMGEFKFEFLSSEYVLLVLPLISLSFLGVFLFYYPLSYWIPDFVNYWLIENDINMFWFEGEHYRLANVLSFLDITLIAPIIEEIFFRGFLLTSLTNRFSIKNSILISSAIFGIVHADLIGATIFGIVLSIIYLKAKSLYAPMIIHIANNALIFIISYFYMVFENVSEYTITDFQNDWWVGLIGLVIGLPWFIYFLRKEIPNANTILPYFSNVRV